MKDIKGDILLIGIGNNGRSDDGLGWAFADEMEAKIAEIDVVYRYQLQIEDAELISHYRKVIFVDSTVEYFPKGYEWRRIKPLIENSFTSHALEPGVILSLCEMVYSVQPDAYQLAISGEEWDLCMELSSLGKKHLNSASNEVFPLIDGLLRPKKVI